MTIPTLPAAPPDRPGYLRTLSIVAFGLSVAVAAGAYLIAKAVGTETYLDRVVWRRVTGGGALVAFLLILAGMWLWRRYQLFARQSPEFRRSLLKVEWEGQWYAETTPGIWKRWDASASDWQRSDPPALAGVQRGSRGRRSTIVPVGADQDRGTELAEQRASEILASARGEAERRRRRIRRGVLGASALMQVIVASLMAGVVVLVGALILGFFDFIDELPW